MASAKPDHYDVLQVSPSACQEVIEAAYRALAKTVHPDISHSKHADRFKAVDEAFNILNDPIKRKAYDRKRPARLENGLGNYEVVRLIAEGGFGRTYEGRHRLTGGAVCIKDCSSIDETLDAVLIAEAKTLEDLRHHSLPAVRELVRLENGRLALIMSYMAGPTLEEVIKKHGPLEPEHVAWIADRLLHGLRYLHHHGVVHGDVKPQNVIIQEEHGASFVDFGLSVVRPTAKTTAKGYTEVYAAPELKNGEPPLPESDFYGLGMTMIFALAGSHEDAERKQVPKTTPDPLCAFIRRLIVRDVLSRPRWENEDLTESIAQVRIESFGRRRSNMKPFPTAS